MLLASASDYEIGARIGEIAGPLVFGLLTFLLVRRARRRSPGRARTTDWIAALVFGALFVAGVTRLVDHRLDPWDTQRGHELHAGFVDGCRPSEAAGLNCECVFEQLTSAPAYDTPDEFATLAQRMSAARRQRDPSVVPPELQAAIASCRVVAIDR